MRTYMTKAILHYVVLVPHLKTVFLLCLNSQVLDFSRLYLTESGSTEDSLNWLNLSPNRSRKPAHFNEHRYQGESLYLFNLTEKVLRCLICIKAECELPFCAGSYPSCLPVSEGELCVYASQRMCVFLGVSLRVNRGHNCSPKRAQSQTWCLLEKMTEEGKEYKRQESNKTKAPTEWVRKVKTTCYSIYKRQKKLREANAGRDQDRQDKEMLKERKKKWWQWNWWRWGRGKKKRTRRRRKGPKKICEEDEKNRVASPESSKEKHLASWLKLKLSITFPSFLQQ